MRVIVVGSGIAGLAFALALQRLDVEVVLLEQAPELGEVGAGIFVTANAVKALEYLDVDITATSVPTELMTYSDYLTDDLLYLTDVAAARMRYGAPAYFVHRADLLNALISGLDDDVFHLNSRVVDVQQTPGEAGAILESGERLSGDAVIGADGLKSAVRAAVFGASEPESSGIVAWRAIFPFDRIADLGLEPACQHLWLGAGRTVVSYPLRANSLYNFVGLVPAEEIAEESWTRSGDLGDLRASFTGSCPRLTGVVDAIDDAFVTGLYYRPPLPEWGAGRIGLIGDAAHPALPTVGQGAAMAVEDAVILADCLVRGGQDAVAAALREFATRRQPRTGRVLGVSRANAMMLSFDTPESARARNGRWRGMRALDPGGLDFWDWAWGYDVTAELDRPATSAAAPSLAKLGGNSSGAVGQEGDPWEQALTPADRALGWVGERAGYERYWARVGPLRDPAEAKEVDCDGVAALQLGARRSDHAITVLHLHGGGFTMGSVHSSAEYASRLAKAVDGVVLNVGYRLAPENPFPAALDDALTAYGWLAREVGDDRIILSGEGAGGGLAINVALALRDGGLGRPHGVYAVSPFCDLALTGESIDGARAADNWHSREVLSTMSASYLQGFEPSDPQCSPLYANLSGLPPLLIQAAAGEALADDARRLADRARDAGVEVSFRLFATDIHAFPLFPGLPDADSALGDLSSWLREIAGVSTG